MNDSADTLAFCDCRLSVRVWSCGAGGCLCLFALLFTSATRRWLPQTSHSLLKTACCPGLAPRDGGTHGPTGIQPHTAAEPPAPSPQPGPLRAWEHSAPRCCCACPCPGAPLSWWLPGVKQVLLTLSNWLPGGGGLFRIWKKKWSAQIASAPEEET